MKNKEAFLKELQSRLAVLQESERRDILDEYAQHIDLRMAGGLTEEEAIRDFGDMDQLTAEILEAYHVDPDFGKSTVKKAMPDPRPALRKGVSGAGDWFRRWGGRIRDGFSRLGRGIAGFFHRIGTGVKNLFRRSEPELDAETAAIREEEKRMEQTERQEKRAERRTRAEASIRRAGGGLGRFCRGAVRLAWNLALLVCAVPFAALALAALVCLGFLLVLLAQGYPLMGSASLVCLGTIAACVGLLGLGSELIWHKARPEAAEETVAEEEAGYEKE